jgi:two-component system response regulator
MAEPAVVLMVDNNPGDLDLVRIAMAESGLQAELQTASDGREGQQRLQRMADGEERPCQVILLDLNMPRMDGRQLLSWIRTHPRLATMPTIILTSSHMDRDRRLSMSLGATDYWVKPSDFGEFVALIDSLRRHLSDKALASDRQGPPL